MPLITSRGETNLSVSGQVTDTKNQPLAGVSIVDSTRLSTTTDSKGLYTLSGLDSGKHALAPSKSGYVFTPSMLSIDVTAGASGQDFHALAACSDLIVNGEFELVGDWNIPVTAFSAGYSSDQGHGGLRSMRTGIIFQTHNRFSYSDAFQLVNIPLTAKSATLSLWEYSTTGEPTGLAPSQRPTGELFAPAALGHDVQYVLLLDSFGNWINTLLWQRSNAQTWTSHQFDLSRYAGSTIRIQFGTFNDGLDGATSMYVDDISLQVCQ